MDTEPRIYRASSLGYSLEQLVAPFLGYQAIPPPEWLQQKFDEGKEIEPKCIEKLRGYGWGILVAQDEVNAVGDNQIEVELEVIPGVAKVVGHLDGHITEAQYADNLLRNAILEVKSMAGRAWNEFEDRKWEAGGIIQKYKWQASALMLATEMPHMMVAWNKDTEELSFALTMEPFYTISDIANKLQSAEDYISRGVIPEGCTDYPCPYFYLHEPIADPEPADDILNGLLDAWKVANHRRKVEELTEKNLREAIKEYVGEIAGKVKGSQGITVSTNWVEAKEVSYTKPGHWETRITPPRERKGDSAA